MRRIATWTAPLAAFLAGTLVLPGAWCRRGGDALYEGDSQHQRRLARGVDHWVGEDLFEHRFGTGSRRFDGEWLFGTHVMAAVGYGQTAMQQPELRDDHLRRMEGCIEVALHEEVRAFDREAWGSDPIDDLGTDRAHAAYLGYLSLALALHRSLDPTSRFAPLHDRITAHLARLVEESDTALIETYPGEVYPVDNASFIGALGIHGGVHEGLVATWLERLPRWRDPDTGLLYQAVSIDGEPRDAPRGSGTALASYFLSWADRDASASLYASMREHLYRDGLGFGAMREYPQGQAGLGDVDSGPIFAGLGVSATGFALASARIHGDREAYAAMWATTQLFGAPVDRRDGRRFAFGGPIGDTLLFAMLTAPKGDR